MSTASSKVEDAEKAALQYELEFYNRLLSQHDERLRSNTSTLQTATNTNSKNNASNPYKIDLKITRDYSMNRNRSIVVHSATNVPPNHPITEINSNHRTVIQNKGDSFTFNPSILSLQKSSITSPSLHKKYLLSQKGKDNISKNSNSACNKRIVVNNSKTKFVNCVKSNVDNISCKKVETKPNSQKLMNEIMAITQQLKQRSQNISSSSGVGNSCLISTKNEPPSVLNLKLCAKTSMPLKTCIKRASDKNQLDAVDEDERMKSVQMDKRKLPVKRLKLSIQDLHVSQGATSSSCGIKNIYTTKSPSELKVAATDLLVGTSKLVLMEKCLKNCQKDKENPCKVNILECNTMQKVVTKKLKLKSSPNSGKKPLVCRKLMASKYKIINEKSTNIHTITFANQPRKSTMKSSPILKNSVHKWTSLSPRQKNKAPVVEKKLNSKYKVVNKMQNSTAKLKVSPVLKKTPVLKKGQSSYRYVRDAKYVGSLKKDKSVIRLRSLQRNMFTPNKHVFSRRKVNQSVCGSVKKPHSRKNSLSWNSKYRVVNRASSNLQSAKKIKSNSSDLKNMQSSSMDMDLLLELAAQKNSSDEKASCVGPLERPPLLKRIYKTKRTLINKNACSVQAKVAKMIKTKYSVLNKTHLWQRQGISRRFSSFRFKGQQFNDSFRKRAYTPSFYNQKIKRNFSPKVYHNKQITRFSRMSSKGMSNFRNRYVSFGPLQSFKTSKRIVTRRNIFVKSPINVMKSSPVSKVLASRVLHRSINRVLTASAKKKMSKVNTYCMFYNRFGRCNKGIKCSYVHDPSKIAICTRFLRGTCKTENCPFSHEICPGKIAICSFYLLGSCTKAKCPYRHETLSPDSKLCKAFVQGYCSNGKQCKRAHILVCPAYIQGICAKGNACAFPHPPQKDKKIFSIEAEDSKELDDLLVSRYFQPMSDLDLNNDGPKGSNSSVVPKRETLPEQPSFIALTFSDDES